MSSTIALLTVRSGLYPSISFDLINGFRAGLNEKGLADIQLQTESTAFAAEQKVIYAVCERMLMNGVKIVIAYINPSFAELLQPLFASGDALLIALDSGFQYPSQSIALPNVITLSLDGSLCCRIAARNAIIDGHKKFGFVTSYYDSGYRGGDSFANVLEKNGAQFVFNHITALRRAEFTLDPLIEFQKNGNHADALLASFCGDMAEDFFAFGKRAGLFEKTPVYASTFAFEEDQLEKIPFPNGKITGTTPWFRSLEHEENHRFLHVMNKHKAKTNLFSLLGWEAAVIVSKVIENNERINGGADQLKGLEFKSPRGTVRIAPETNSSEGPLYDIFLAENKTTGNSQISFLGENKNAPEERSLLGKRFAEVQFTSSWFNAYPCIE